MSKDWWRGAVFYQVYPRSYYDSNNDGIGDLQGITEKLPYIADLGVDGIWLSPFFTSPMKDFGYDIADFYTVDPIFGSVEDFKHLLKTAHDLGVKVIIDQVLSHTSDLHDWFVESRKNRDNDKSDWYVWVDPNPDGTPPNNWPSVFGGPAWSYDVRRGQYYFHAFLKEQPDLNLYNPDVKKAVFDVLRFWLDLGVDGFRLDVTNHFLHDDQLRNNPPNPNPPTVGFNIDFAVPYMMQKHDYDKSQPQTVPLLEEVRAVMDEYDNRMTVGEVGDDRGVQIAAVYTDGNKRLHTAYNFSLISGTKLSASYIRSAIEEFENQPTQSWPSWAFSNHDVVRAVSRWGNEHKNNPALAQLLIAMLVTLRGTAFMYQGEELGLTDATIPFEKIQDPWGFYLWPEWQGRDGCRTPMVWDSAAPHGGFSAGETTWLPVPSEHLDLAVNKQLQNKDSALNGTKAFLNWRKAQDILRFGDIAFHDTDDDELMVFERSHDQNKMLCIFNLSPDTKEVSPLQGFSTCVYDGTGPCDKKPESALPGFGFMIIAPS